MEGRTTRIGLRIWAVAVLLFLFVPIAIIFLYAFNSSNIQAWPIQGLARSGSPSPGTTRRCTPRFGFR